MPLDNFKDLMRLVHGFETAKIFLVANDMGLFPAIGNGCTVQELAEILSVEEKALELVMNALVALGLLMTDGHIYENTAFSKTYLAGEDRRDHIFKHIHHCWESWNELAEVLRCGYPRLIREKNILHDADISNRDFILGMDDVTRDLAPQVVNQLDLCSARNLLDLGGGPGTYAKAFLEAYPELQKVTIFDLPLALKIAQGCLANYSHRERITFLEGDFSQDELGSHYDVIWISQVLHSQNESGCQLLIDKAWQALRPGGQLIIHEFLLEKNKIAPLAATLFAVHMLVMTKGGRTYSGDEISSWLNSRGFSDINVKKVSEDTGVVMGTKSCSHGA